MGLVHSLSGEMLNDSDTLRKGQPTSVRQPGLTSTSEEVTTPQKKNLSRLWCLALLPRCTTGTLLTTVCSHIKRIEGNTCNC